MKTVPRMDGKVMTVLELRELLARLPGYAEITIAVYQPNDSGEQDHYEIDSVVEYPDGSVQVKTK